MNREGRCAACLRTSLERSVSGIPGGSVDLGLRFDHLKRARHLDSYWFAHLEMDNQPLLADM